MHKLNGFFAIVIALFGAFLAVNAFALSGNNLGAKSCTWGPSYWCSNLTNAKGCHAVRHCIQTVWEKHYVPEDDDSICKICKDMVTQARDQLQSNETMQDLKDVFEGSCKLIPIKVVNKECCKLADDFIPELVEALSSQMNPDQVCSVAGLCNNAEIDRLLSLHYQGALEGNLEEEQEEDYITTTVEPPVEKSKTPLLSCGNCNQLSTILMQKFNNADRDEVMETILHLCGEMSSFSDACASLTLTYFNELYDYLKEHLNSDAICHLSGTCANLYHQHAEDSATTEPTYDLSLPENDDIPCELCQQLVQHLRDVLVANTTEEEFEQILQGFCKQAHNFKDECLSIVDQYYDVIYNTLVKSLDTKGACFLIGVCPKGLISHVFENDIRPLLPVFPPAKIDVKIRPLLGKNEPKFTQEEIQNMQLPIERYMPSAPNAVQLVESGALCEICEFTLHLVQEELSTPANENEIKIAVNGICDKMPTTVKGHCHDLIDMYSDAIIALLIQGLNPREICPKMRICPPSEELSHDTEIFSPVSIHVDETDKPTCPLCVFAVEQAKQKIENNRTKKHIEHVLSNLCTHLPTKLQKECVDFVNTYYNELLDMLITDFSAQEICETLQLCPKTNSILHDLGLIDEENSASNEVDHKNKGPKENASPNCLLCEEVVKMVEKRMGKHPTKESIEKALQHSCLKLRKNLEIKCHKFVSTYGDKIAELLLREVEPKMLCRELGFCLWNEQDDLEIDEALKYDVIAMPNSEMSQDNEKLTGADDKETPTCVLCEFILAKIQLQLNNKSSKDEIKQVVSYICQAMPKTVEKNCDDFINKYSETIIQLITTMPTHQICSHMMLCLTKLPTDSVIECGVCYGAVTSLFPYLKQRSDTTDIKISDMMTVGCANLPGKYYEQCTEMMSIYGQSLINLAQRKNINESSVCAEIGKCYANENSHLAFARISV